MKKLAVFASILLWASVLSAQSPAAAPPQQGNPSAAALETLQQQIRDLQERVITLEGQLRIMKAQQPSPPPPNELRGLETPQTAAAPSAAPPIAGTAPPAATASASSPSSAAPSLGGAASLAKALNPDISMIGDFLSSAGGNSKPRFAQQSPVSAFQMHESELGIQAIVDPYARGDFFITFGEQGVALEEGFITLTSLPAGFVGRIGKMRAAFGKVNTMHNHVMPWADRPLVTDNLVGGEDGINDAGFSVTRAFAAPEKIFVEATGQLFRGDSGDSSLHPLFSSSRKSDVSTVAHLRAYRDLTESTNLDLGASYARGHSDLGNVASAANSTASTADLVSAFNRSFVTNLYGLDATLRWKPLRRAIYHSLIARSEFIWNQRQQLNAIPGASSAAGLTQQFVPATKRSFGYYASADYQLARRWFIGGRYDSSERVTSSGTDHGTSAVLTFWPSEFSQLRTQYRSTRYAEGRNANELLVQVQFVLGAHGAHPF